MIWTVVIRSFFLIFALIGFFTALSALVDFFLLYGKNNAESISLVCTLKGNDAKTEYILRSLKSYTDGINTKSGEPLIYIINDRMDHETLKMVNEFCEESNNIILLEKDEFLDHMQKTL